MRIDLFLPCLFLALGASSTTTLAWPVGVVDPAKGEAATVDVEIGAVLARALGTIEADEISADLHFLASDEMKGRDTPSPEQRIAARFIAARLGRLGWQHGAQDGYFWEFEMPTSAVDSELTGMKGQAGEQSVSLVLGADYAFHPRSSMDLEVEASQLVYGGTLSKDDAEGLGLEGRWVLCRSSVEVGYREISKLVRRGDAAGVIVLPGGELEGPAMTERVKDWGRQVCETRLSRGRSNRKAPSFLYMTEEGGSKLLQLAGASELQLGDVLDVHLQETRVMTEGATTGLENVVGLWPGRDPELAKELIILSAHYDHVGTNESGEVFNGADDNGSGTVGLLAVAESLASYGPMRRSVMLMWVSGEEKGLLGSAAWTKDPFLPGGLKPVANINIDMIGRNAGDSLLVTPTASHEEYNGLTRMAESLSAEEGFPSLGDADAYWGRSDHANFSRNLDIPVAFLFSDIHEDYHKVTDTPDKIDYDKIRRVARLVVRMLHGLQTDELDLD
jgi:hypothetical protein